MKIETYKLEDNSTEVSAMVADSTAIELCQELGLEGQLSISNTETMTRAPFGVMTAEEYKVYSYACPSKVDIKEYKFEPIPLRVLEVYKFAISQECAIRFDSIKVWSTTMAEIKDPLLVGEVKTGPYQTTYYLLARWGKELLPFLEFQDQVMATHKVKLTKKLNEIKYKLEAAIANIDNTAEDLSMPSFHY